MKNMCLNDAGCHVQQALAILSIWLESIGPTDKEHCISGVVGGLISILNDVPSAIDEAEGEIIRLKNTIKSKG